MRRYLLFIFILVMLTSTAYAGEVNGKVKTRGVKDSRNIVVYIERVDGDFPPSEAHAVMDQIDLEFIPHVLPVVKGSTVEYLNSDEVLHNVFTPENCAEKFNLGTWPKGEKRSYTFNELGCVSVMLCNVHPEMEAWILVLQNPYFFVTDKDGVYSIKDVPPGEYNLIAWHEKLKSKEQTITVAADGSVKADFSLSRR